MEQQELNQSLKQKTIAAHVDSKILSGTAHEGSLRAHQPGAFKKFKDAARRIIVTHEVYEQCHACVTTPHAACRHPATVQPAGQHTNTCMLSAGFNAGCCATQVLTLLHGASHVLTTAQQEYQQGKLLPRYA